MHFPRDINFIFYPQWYEQYAFTIDKNRQLRQDLAPLLKYQQNLKGYLNSEGFKNIAKIELKGIKNKNIYNLVPYLVGKQVLPI